MSNPYYYIGLISGTSVDGIDAVVVSIDSNSDPRGNFELLAAHMEPFPPTVSGRIRSILTPGHGDIDDCGFLDIELGTLFAKAALKALSKTKLERSQIRAIGSHGQTIRHRPNGEHPFSLQIGDPSLIAEITGVTTVADFRARDIAAGGQGAPLVPAFHNWLFKSATRSRTVVNIGGIANITHIPMSGPIVGFDTGPGNTLLDQWIHRHKNQDYDRDGNWALSGDVVEPLLKRLLIDPYFEEPFPKSTGREYFNMAWLQKALSDVGTNIVEQDVQATLAELTAATIANHIRRITTGTDEIFVCGGGGHNTAIMHALQRHVDGIPVSTTESIGLHPDWVEACAFAWLAHQRLENRPGNISSVTGAKHLSVLGGVYAGTTDTEQ